MKSTEALQAGHLEDVLKLKGFTVEELERIFKASTNAGEHQIMLMDTIMQANGKKPKEKDRDFAINSIVEKYKVLRANDYPL